MNTTLLAGILFSLIFTELTDLSPGGIIVPAYFALYAASPARMAGTVLIALLSMGFVRLLSSCMILYGRRRYAVYLICGILLKWLLSTAGFSLGFGRFLSIGSLIPGILGRECERQHIFPTLLSLAAVPAATVLLEMLIRIF